MAEDTRPRLPAGQFLTERFPVLTHGDTQIVPTDDWQFRVWGYGLEDEIVFSWDEFIALGGMEIEKDFHCVTTWSRYDNRWKGVPVSALWSRIETELSENPRALMFHCHGGYTTNLRLKEALVDGNLFATHHDDEELSNEHGGPMRFVCHHLYAWKSPKWVCGIELLENDKRGFWEKHGYHNSADPWAEERYSYQEGKADKAIK